MEEKLEKLMKRLDKSLSKDKTMKKILIAISIFMDDMVAIPRYPQAKR